MLFKTSLFISFYIFYSLFSIVQCIPNVDLNVNNDGSYTLFINQNQWLQSGETGFRSNNQYYTTSNQTLILTQKEVSNNNTDAIGTFNTISLYWNSSDLLFQFQTNFHMYTSLTTQSSSPSSSNTIRAIISEQIYLTTCNQTQTSRQSVISSFPSFLVESSQNLGWYEWAGEFFWGNKRNGQWNSNDASAIYGGIEYGPLILYDSNQTSQTAIMISPFASLMSASMGLFKPTSTVKSYQVAFGPIGNAESVPSAYSTSTMLYFDDCGIRCNVLKWGKIYTTFHHKDVTTVFDHLTNAYLGYNTDRGAYYYLYSEPNHTYESTMYAVKNYSEQMSIPYRYWLTDSRWYKEGADGGVVTWVPLDTFFPSGFPTFSKNLGWKMITHNRYFSSITTYAKQNGGLYNFAMQNNMSLPLDQIFWDDLITNSSDWGMSVYWQDWLFTVSDGLNMINSDLNLGDSWLYQMSKATTTYGLGIQYCMALYRHLLSSVQFQNVIQVRVSYDGMPGQDQWTIGESALLAFSLGNAPFKDNFWTSKVQPGNPYYKGATETAPYLQAAMATLSTGPVAPGDGIGYTNVSLLMKSCRQDGYLLKPDEPITSLDIWFYERSFTKPTPTFELMCTFTTMNSELTWYYVIGVGFVQNYDVTAEMLHIDLRKQSYVFYSFQNNVYNWSGIQILDENHQNPLVMTPCNKENFLMYYITPILNNNLILYGEVDKWVPISKGRIQDLIISSDSITLNLIGSEGEVVVIVYAPSNKPSSLYSAACLVKTEGTVQLVISSTSFQYKCTAF